MSYVEMKEVKKIEISKEERERRERFKKMFAGLRTANKDLAEAQKECRLAKQSKYILRALEITVILNLMLKVRGLSQEREKVVYECPCPDCDHRHTVMVPIHGFRKYDGSQYFRDVAKEYHDRFIAKFGCGEFLK